MSALLEFSGVFGDSCEIGAKGHCVPVWLSRQPRTTLKRPAAVSSPEIRGWYARESVSKLFVPLGLLCASAGETLCEYRAGLVAGVL